MGCPMPPAVVANLKKGHGQYAAEVAAGANAGAAGTIGPYGVSRGNGAGGAGGADGKGAGGGPLPYDATKDARAYLPRKPYDSAELQSNAADFVELPPPGETDIWGGPAMQPLESFGQDGTIIDSGIDTSAGIGPALACAPVAAEAAWLLGPPPLITPESPAQTAAALIRQSQSRELCAWFL